MVVFFLRLGRVTGEEKAGVPAGEIGTDGIVVQRTVVLGGRRYDLQRSRSHVNGDDRRLKALQCGNGVRNNISAHLTLHCKPDI